MAFYKWLIDGDVDPYSKQVWTTDWTVNPRIHSRGALSVNRAPDIMKFIPYDGMPGRLWKVETEGNSLIWDRFAHFERVRLDEFYGALDCDWREFGVAMAENFIHILDQKGANTRKGRVMLGHMKMLLRDPAYTHPDLEVGTAMFLMSIRSSLRRTNPERGWGDLTFGFMHMTDHEVSFELTKGVKPWLKV